MNFHLKKTTFILSFITNKYVLCRIYWSKTLYQIYLYEIKSISSTSIRVLNNICFEFKVYTYLNKICNETYVQVIFKCILKSK